MQLGGNLPTIVTCAALFAGGAAFALLLRFLTRSTLERTILALARGDSDAIRAIAKIPFRRPVAEALEALADKPRSLPLPVEESALGLLFTAYRAGSDDSRPMPDKAFYVAVVGAERIHAMRQAFGDSFADSVTRALVSRTMRDVPAMRIGRVGGAFFELGFEARDRVEAEDILKRLQALLGERFALGGQQLELAISIAATEASPDDRNIAAMTRRVEHAFSQLRESRRVVILDNWCDPDQVDQLSIVRELSGALANDELFVVYQPKLRLRSGEIDSAEALLRWRHPTRGLVPPNVFIPFAEQSGLIRELTLWVLKRAIADQQRLAAEGHPLLIYVNISGRLLTDNNFLREAGPLVGAASNAIGFEITETAIIDDPDHAMANLTRFAGMGISISIDDYGSGVSSLAYLKQLPARELKIDQMFISDLTSSHRDPLIVRSTIDLAHALEMEVTAEGVESPAALALLRVMGCDIVQGYLVSQPLVIEEFSRFLIENRHLDLGVDATPTLRRPASFWRRA